MSSKDMGRSRSSTASTSVLSIKKFKVVEPLGNENHLHVEVGGATFVARCEGRRIVKAGAKLNIAFNLEQLHLFDAKTSQVIYQGL